MWGWGLFGLLTWFLPFSEELVVHSTEWSTGSRLFGLLTRFPPVPRELVVHSKEWTTGSHLFGAFDLVSATFRGASGPLDGVDHWLAAFWAFDPVSSQVQNPV